MILVKNALNSFECKFSAVLIIISILHAADGNFKGNPIEYPDSPELVESSEASSSFLYSENTIEDDDYPTEKLEEIVNEIYKILKSDDEEGKRKLKLKPSQYSYFLRPLKIAEPPKTTKMNIRKQKSYSGEGCSAEYRLVRSKERTDDSGTKHIVVNVENFKQYINTTICRNSGHSCENAFEAPLLYQYKCKEAYNTVGLISIPVGKEVVKENVDMYYFRYPTKCICDLDRN